jgi:hypothetical protein
VNTLGSVPNPFLAVGPVCAIHQKIDCLFFARISVPLLVSSVETGTPHDTIGGIPKRLKQGEELSGCLTHSNNYYSPRGGVREGVGDAPLVQVGSGVRVEVGVFVMVGVKVMVGV